jgi:hypothetical protein
VYNQHNDKEASGDREEAKDINVATQCGLHKIQQEGTQGYFRMGNTEEGLRAGLQIP